MKDFSKEYINRLISLLEEIDLDALESFTVEIAKRSSSESRIFILGNGGSAATASHMVNDLGVGLRRRGVLNVDIHSLADNTPVVTAAANDIGYDNIFVIQLEGLLKKDDLVVALSCSGNSPNIIKAVEYAKEMGCTVVGITGFDGGVLRKCSDISLHVDAPAGEYGLVEDIHMIYDHLMYSYYLSVKFPK